MHAGNTLKDFTSVTLSVAYGKAINSYQMPILEIRISEN